MRILQSHLLAKSLVATMLAGSASLVAQQSFMGGGGSGSIPASTPTKTTSSAQPLQDTTPKKLISAEVHDGVLTIDGLIAKVKLNYDIHKEGYLYFYVPQGGTAIVSLVETPGSVKVEDAFHGDTLNFSAGGHSFELTNSGSLLGRGKTDAYVRFDQQAQGYDRYPMMGFGDVSTAPYAWPGAKSEPMSASAKIDPSAPYAYYAAPPPTPKNLLPKTTSTSAPAPSSTIHP